MNLPLERSRLNLVWDIAYATGAIPAYPEFKLFNNPEKAQRDAWVSNRLMILTHKSQ